MYGILACAVPIGAQTVEFVPRANRPAERLLDEFLERGGYELWTRDTVLTASDTVRGSVLVLQAVARVSGRVEGSVYVVDGDLFLRPGSLVEGEIVVLGGGFYGSRLAAVRGEQVWRPADGYEVVPRDGGWVIYPSEEPPRAVQLHGLYGFGLPTYQRVDEWTFSWGATLRATGLPWQPTLEVVGRYLTEPERFQGTVRQLWYPTGKWQFGLEAERATRTHDAWMRGDALNTLSFLFVGEDFRDYYRADRVAFVAARVREAQWTPSLTVAWEEARSTVARGQTILFDADEVRPNPEIDPGETWSVTLALDIRRRAGASRLQARVAGEAADSTVGGDFSFLLGEARVLWETPLPAGHGLELFAIGRGDLAGTLPRQRWSAIGGRMTLPTFPTLGLRGPRLAFGQATFLVPVPALRLGVFGQPRFLVRVAVGSAWNEGESARFEQNLAAGIRMLGGEFLLVNDPGEGGVLVAARVKIPGSL